MIIVRNDSVIQRNTRIGQFTSLGGLVILAVGMYISFAQPQLIMVSWGALLIGFMLSQVGIYYGNRFGRRPRPDEHIETALKGTDDRYTIYHYGKLASHLLVGPAGVWVLMPRNISGKIAYEKGRWKQRWGGLGAAYMRFFAQEGIGRLDLEVPGEIEQVQSFLNKNLPELEGLQVQAALIFTHPRVELEDMSAAPVASIKIDDLKQLLRKRAKEQQLSQTKIKLITDALDA